jgi:hypothetical protein
LKAWRWAVFKDGSTFLTERGLAQLCGVDQKSIGHHAKAWRDRKRDGGVAASLEAEGYAEDELFTPLPDGSHAYSERVCMAFLKYYALDAKAPTVGARRTMSKLLNAGLRFYIYGSLGYDPNSEINALWRQFHDRMALNPVPSGYFSIFKEGADLVVRAIQSGLSYGHETIPDISIGQIWGPRWTSKNLAQEYGDRCKHEHEYPEYFPQSKSRFAIEAWITPMRHYPRSANGSIPSMPPSTSNAISLNRVSPRLATHDNERPGLAKTREANVSAKRHLPR